MLRVAVIVAVIAAIAVVVWKTIPGEAKESSTTAARSTEPSTAHSSPGTGPSDASLVERPSAQAQRPAERPSLTDQPRAALAAIDATDEEARAIEVIETDFGAAFDKIPEALSGDDRVNAVLELGESKRDKLIELLGEQRADWYRKAAAQELEPEIDRLLMPPSDAGAPAQDP